MKRLKKIVKWSSIIGLSYFVINTLYFGYDDTDGKKGIHDFYWSGLNGLWKKNKDFGFKKNEPVTTYLDGIDGPYIYGDTVFAVDENNKFQTYQLTDDKNITVRTSCDQLPNFNVALRDSIVSEPQQYEMPDKLIAISDIEVNFRDCIVF